MKLRCLPPYLSVIVIALLPLTYPTTFAAAIFGGMLKHIGFILATNTLRFPRLRTPKPLCLLDFRSVYLRIPTPYRD